MSNDMKISRVEAKIIGAKMALALWTCENEEQREGVMSAKRHVGESMQYHVWCAYEQAFDDETDRLRAENAARATRALLERQRQKRKARIES